MKRQVSASEAFSMIENISSIDRYVYHYTKAETARDYILKSGTLRLDSYAATNDPKETKQWEFGLGTSREISLNGYKHLELSAWLSNELKRRTRLACFSMDKNPLTGNHLSDVLNRGFAKPRMWAQYAANHTGVCLVFEKNILTTTLTEHLGSIQWIAAPVNYQNRSNFRGLEAHEFMLNVDEYNLLGPTKYPAEHARRFLKELYFEKLEDWRDENEWRIVAFTDEADKVFLPIRKCLVGVMHGDATDPDLSEELMRLTLGWNGVQHMGLSWKNSSPWYDYGSFGWQPGKVLAPRRRTNEMS
jgi:hypothetical protein